MGKEIGNKELERVVLEVLEAKAVEIRDVDAGAEPFLYASGNWGPGYVSIKNLVGRKSIIKRLVEQLAKKVAERAPYLEFVAGNVTGGLVPGWLLSERLEPLFGRTVPFVYIREARKKGGQKELVTGIANNPEIRSGANGLVVEELVNFAETTCHGAEALRDAEYQVTHAACIMFYDNPEAHKALQEAKIEIVYLFTLPQLLAIAEKNKAHSQKAIDGYREFLNNPLGWQAKRGFKPVKEGGTK